MTTQSEQNLENTTPRLYYWLASQQLAAGSVVEPGTWYKIVSNSSGHSHALMEEVYERIRAESYPLRPSRQKSMYLFDDESIAAKFKNDNGWDHTDLYKVEITDPHAKQTKLNSDLVSIGNGSRLHTINELARKASTYWESANSECAKPEVLVESSIKIVEKVTE